AEIHDPGAAALHLIHQEQEDDHDEDEGQKRQQQADQEVLPRVVDGEGGQLARIGLVPQQVLYFIARAVDDLGSDLVTAVDLYAVFERELEVRLVAAHELGALDLIVVQRGEGFGGVDTLVSAR